MAYGDYPDYTTAGVEVDNSTLTDTDTTSETDNGQDNGTSLGSVGSFSGLETGSSAETAVESDRAVGSGTTTENDSSNATLSELGVYSNGSFAFASVIYQATSGLSVVMQDSATDSGSINENILESGSDNSDDGDSMGCIADGDDESASDSLSIGENSVEAGSEDYDETDSDSSYTYEAGSYGSTGYSFGSVVYTSTGWDDYSSEGTIADSMSGTECGTEGDSSVESNSAVVAGSLLAGGMLTVSNAGSFSTSEIVNFALGGSDTQIASDTGDSSDSLYEAGSYSGGSYSLGCYVFSEC